MRAIGFGAILFGLAVSATFAKEPAANFDERFMVHPHSARALNRRMLSEPPPLVEGAKFPNSFLRRWWASAHAGGEPYTHCDYTSKTCRRGLMRDSGCFVGAIVPDGERDRVLKNISDCRGIFTDYATGETTNRRSRWVPLARDLPERCVEGARKSGVASECRF